MRSSRSWITGAAIALLTCGSPVMGAEIIVDEFSEATPIRSAGEQFPAGQAPSGVAWQVVKGRASSDGELGGGGAIGCLTFDRKSETQVKIPFGPIQANTAAEVKFALKQWDGAGAQTGFYVLIELGCEEINKSYRVLLSIAPGYYGTPDGGMTGVGITDSVGTVPGAPGAHFPNGPEGQRFHDLSLRFDPSEGISVYLNSDLIATLENRDELPKVDYFTLSNKGNSDGNHLSWQMTRFSVDAVLVQ